MSGQKLSQLYRRGNGADKQEEVWKVMQIHDKRIVRVVRQRERGRCKTDMGRWEGKQRNRERERKMGKKEERKKNREGGTDRETEDGSFCA